MPKTERSSFCRICSGFCGVKVSLAEDGSVLQVRGNKQHPLTLGYACLKGLVADVEGQEARISRPLKRQPDGSFAHVPLDHALDEIAEKLSAILEKNGVDAVGCFRGTMNYMNAAGYHMMSAWRDAIGSSSFFSTLTIDQSAKLVTIERLGSWGAGRQPFQTADLWMFVGSNPLVARALSIGYAPSHPLKQIKDAKARGMTLIVVDPRKCETAQFADHFVQIRPGEDPTFAAGVLNLLFEEDLYDATFCEAYVEGLDDLRRAVSRFTPVYVAERAGIPEAQLREVSRVFGTAKRGVVRTGTGPNMSPHSNLAEHLYECLNVICGRYARAGDLIPAPHPLRAKAPVYAEVLPPKRSWEAKPSRLGDFGPLVSEKMSGTLVGEIQTPGPEQVRALLIVGGNPVTALPDPMHTIEAFKELELLVVVEPFMTATAKLAHYIIPPTMQYEQAGLTFGYPTNFQTSFAQYAAPLATPPAGSEVTDDWRVLWGLASRLGKQIVFAGEPLDMKVAPSTDDLLSILIRDGRTTLDELKRCPDGKQFEFEPEFIQPARPEATGRFQVAPSDVVAEIARLRAEQADPPVFTHRLTSRRMREVQNSVYRELPSIARRHKYNPAYLNPRDLSDQGLTSGDAIELTSAHGSIPAIVEADEAVRPGVVSMSHQWGLLAHEGEADYREAGSSTALLISSRESDLETINAMPLYSGIPVSIQPLRSPSASPRRRR